MNTPLIYRAGTALSILNKMKEQIKDCEAAFVEARDLNKQIQGFEVTVNHRFCIRSRYLLSDRIVLDYDDTYPCSIGGGVRT